MEKLNCMPQDEVFLAVLRRNFVLAECIFVYVSFKVGKIDYDQSFAFFRPAGGFTNFYILKNLSEILYSISP